MIFLVEELFYRYLKNFSLCLLHQTYLLKFFVEKTQLFILLKEPIYHRCKTQKLWPLS